MRKVYLGKLDIAPDGELELRTNGVPFSEEQVLRYLFIYGLICDQVLIQGSSPLKNKRVFSAYLNLFEAFRRNGLNTSDPVYSFIQSDTSYVDYFLSRNFLLRGVNARNPERQAYALNNASAIAEKLDKSLFGAQIVKRTTNVPASFRKGLLSHLKDIEKTDIFLFERTASKVIAKVNNTEFLQTFELTSTLSLINRKEYANLYNLIRTCYRKANASGVSAVDADEILVYQTLNVERFLAAIGLSELLARSRVLKSSLLFQIKALNSYGTLLDEYLKCQTQQHIDEFFSALKGASIKRSITSAARHSIGTAITATTEGMELLGAPKIITKPIEFVAKGMLGDAADRRINQQLATISAHLEEIKRDIQNLKV